MNSKSTWSKVVTIFFGSVLTLIIGMITAPIITRIIDPLEYGQLSFFTMYTSILSLGLSLGLDRAYLRFYYDTDSNKRTILLYDCLKYPILAFTVASPLIYFLGKRVSLETIANKDVVLIIFIINLLMVIMDKFALNVLRIQQKSRAYAISNVMNKVIYAILAIILVQTTGYNHFVILIFSTMIASTITFLTAFLINRNEWTFKKNVGISRQFSPKDLLKYGLPLLLQGMVSVAFQSTDKIMIKHFGTYSDVGVYAAAFYFVNVFSVFTNSISTIIGPEMYKYHAENPNGTEFYVKVNRLITFLMFILGISMIFTKDILVLALGARYREAAYIMPFLIFSPIMSTISGVNAISIEIKKESKYFLIITIISSIFNLIGNYLLIPLLGAKGAAISTGVSFILYFAFTTIIANKLYKFDFGIRRFSIMTLITIIFAIYNTWYEFNIVTIGIYFFSMIVLIISYYEQFLYLYFKVINYFFKR